METLDNLTTFSRSDLLQIIRQQQVLLAEQRATIAQLKAAVDTLQQRVSALEEQLRRKGGSGSGMPGNKPTSTPPQEPPSPRHPRGYGSGRSRMVPTESVDHALDVCPDCGTPLDGGSVQRTREVIDLPITPVRVVEHRFIMRICPACKRRCTPKVDLEGVVLGQQRLSVNVLTLITTLREVGRLPVATIQWLLDTVYHLPLSTGGITAVLHQVAQRAAPEVAAIRDRIRTSPVVHADETGWREDGKNGYVWGLSTATDRYFVRGGRGKGMLDDALGPDFQGVLVSDFYAAYDHYPGLHQRCWVHLLRDCHDLCDLYPKDGGLRNWAAALRRVFEQGKAVTGNAQERQQAQRLLTQELREQCAGPATDALAVQGKLCRRILKYLSELLTFVADPAVPADNNAAEGNLRSLVVQRKISGGTRSPQGSSTVMTLASLFGTWQAQGVNSFTALRQLLTYPQL